LDLGGKDGKGWEKYTNVVLKHLDSRDVPHKKHCHLKGLLRPTAFGFWINSFHKTQFIVSPPPTWFVSGRVCSPALSRYPTVIKGGFARKIQRNMFDYPRYPWHVLTTWLQNSVIEILERLVLNHEISWNI
jgi:hypothetical protein